MQSTGNKPSYSTKSKLGKYALMVLVVIVGLGISAFLFAYYASFSEGTRTGKIVKLSRKGIIFKTYEGQLDIGGITRNKDNYAASSVWDFSIDGGNKEVFDAITVAMDTDQRVKMHYEEKYFYFSWRGDTKYFITKVEKVK